jgi:hypothetical protein
MLMTNVHPAHLDALKNLLVLAVAHGCCTWLLIDMINMFILMLDGLTPTIK